MNSLNLKEVRLDGYETHLKKIYAVNECFPAYYQLLDREERKEKQKRIRDVLEAFLGRDQVVDSVCREQLRRLEEGKACSLGKTLGKDAKRLEEALNCLLLIRTNREEILERELSITATGDTKKFKTDYRRTVCSILKKYEEDADRFQEPADENERNKRLLETYNVVQNPSYIYMKGPAVILCRNGEKLSISSETPIAVCGKTLPDIVSVSVPAARIATVENLTSFNRMNRRDTYYLFLSGYHNGIKNEFLKLLHMQNPGKKWRHYGDIDPDGFYIFENLKKKTGIPFECRRMDIDTLKKYHSYTKPLEPNDRLKAENMIRLGLHSRLLEYMLEHNCKLEQEIVSWRECMTAKD